MPPQKKLKKMYIYVHMHAIKLQVFTKQTKYSELSLNDQWEL